MFRSDRGRYNPIFINSNPMLIYRLLRFRRNVLPLSLGTKSNTHVRGILSYNLIINSDAVR